MRKKVLSVALTAALAFSMTPSAAFAATDIEGHWGQAVLEEWEDYGVIRGYDDGTVRPDAAITRGEMATILDRIMGYQETAENEFSDLSEEDWCMDEMLRAVAAGAFHGDDVDEGEPATIRPNDSISREEAVLVVSRVLDLDTENVPDSGFADDSAISDWAEPSVEAMAAAGYVNGYDDGTFRPQGQITRAEVVKIMDNVFADLYQAEGEYTGNVQGSAVIDSDGVVLEDMTISGDLIIAEGVADGHVELDNVTVEGRLIVRGGGENSVVIKGASKIGQIIVDRLGGAVRIAVQDAAEVADVVVSEAADGVRFEGKVGNLDVQGAASVVEVAGSVDNVEISETADEAKVTILEGAETETVKSQAKSATIVVAGTVATVAVSGEGNQLTVSGTVTAVDVAGKDVVVKVEASATVEKVTTSASGTKVEGEGDVESVVAGEGSSGVTVSTEDTKVENNGSGDVAIEGGAVAPGETDTTPGGSTSGGGGAVVPPVTYYTVTFNAVGGESIPSQSIVANGTISMPKAPEGQQYTLYASNGDVFDPETRITDDMTLTAVLGSDSFSGGNGTEEYPYLISSETELKAIDSLSEEMRLGSKRYFFNQTQDIDVYGYNGLYASYTGYIIKHFSGVYDGGGHDIALMDASENPFSTCLVVCGYGDAVFKSINIFSNQNNMFVTCLFGGYDAWTDQTVTTNLNFDGIVSDNVEETTFVTPSQNWGCFCYGNFGDNGSVSFRDCISNANYSVGIKMWAAIFQGGYGNPSNALSFERCVNNGEVQGPNVAMFVGNSASVVALQDITVSNCENNGRIVGTETSDYFARFGSYSAYDDINALCHSNTGMVSGNGYIGLVSAKGMSLTKSDSGALVINPPDDPSGVAYYVINILQQFPVTGSSSSVNISRKFETAGETDFFVGKVISSDKCSQYGIEDASLNFGEASYCIVEQEGEVYYVFDVEKLQPGANLDGNGTYYLYAFDSADKFLGSAKGDF